jgi:hypothetical protein
VTRRILALAVFASLMPFAAMADDIGASEDIVVEPEPQMQERPGTMVMEEKPVSLPPPGWRAPQPSDQDQDEKR